jgi:hypothetical protein
MSRAANDNENLELNPLRATHIDIPYVRVAGNQKSPDVIMSAQEYEKWFFEPAGDWVPTEQQLTISLMFLENYYNNGLSDKYDYDFANFVDDVTSNDHDEWLQVLKESQLKEIYLFYQNRFNEPAYPIVSENLVNQFKIWRKWDYRRADTQSAAPGTSIVRMR